MWPNREASRGRRGALAAISLRERAWWAPALTLLACFLASSGPAAPARAPRSSGPPSGPITFTGRAFVLESIGRVLRTERLVDAGLLPPEGGTRQKAALTGTISNLVSADVLYAVTVGAEGRCSSEASLANLDLTVGGQRITAGFVAARASAVVREGRVQVAGLSEVVGLAVNGRPVPVSGQANQKVALPNGVLVINEQKAAVSGAKGDLLVWALRVLIKDTGTVGIGLAQAGLSVGSPRPCDQDFVTGNGWITDVGGQPRLFFSFAAGNRNGALEGHFNFIDPRGIRLATTEVATYAVIDANTRVFTGNAEYNGIPGMGYRLEVTDTGERGPGDHITLLLGNAYAARGILQSGNVTLFPCR